MGYLITEGSEQYDIEPSDFVKIRALEDGFPQQHGEIVRKGKEADIPGSVFANGKPSWFVILGVFGAKKVETVEIDTSKKKAPKKVVSE